jgi:hypothetical protein
MEDALDETNKDAAGIPFTVRSVFVVDPKNIIRLSLTYPASTGRHFDEILRVVDSLQLGDKNRITTPVCFLLVFSSLTPLRCRPSFRASSFAGQLAARTEGDRTPLNFHERRQEGAFAVSPFPFSAFTDMPLSYPFTDFPS